MKFKPGQSGNPAGRPRGSVSGITLIRQRLEAKGGIEAFLDYLIEQAQGGDMTAYKMILDRVWPPLKATIQPIEFDLPNTTNPREIALAIIRQMAQGKIPPDVAASLVSTIAGLYNIGQAEEVERMLEQLEARETASLEKLQ